MNKQPSKSELKRLSVQRGGKSSDADDVREKQPPPNNQWCVGCDPENCSGCGVPEQTDVVEEFRSRLTNNANDFDGIVMDMLNALIATRQELEKHQWISVEDRFPENGVLVLISYSNKNHEKSSIHMARYTGDVWFFIHHDSMKKNISRVTHWMPLPPTPQGD